MDPSPPAPALVSMRAFIQTRAPGRPPMYIGTYLYVHGASYVQTKTFGRAGWGHAPLQLALRPQKGETVKRPLSSAGRPPKYCCRR